MLLAVDREELPERHARELLDALVEFEERHLERQRERAADARLARAAQSDERDALGVLGDERQVDELRERGAQGLRERGEFQDAEVRAPGFGLGHVAAREPRAQGEVRYAESSAHARLAQAAAQFGEHGLAFHRSELYSTHQR